MENKYETNTDFTFNVNKNLKIILEKEHDIKISQATIIKIINDSDLKKKKFDYLVVLPWHFRDFIIEKEKNYLKKGKKLIFPLPDIEII